MAFDPSVISGIGESVTGPVANAPGRAMQLGDLINREQVSRLGLKEELETQNTYEAIKKETKGMDWSNPDDQNKAIAIAAKHSPKVAMELQREFTAQQSSQAQLTSAKIAETKERLSVLNDAATPFIVMTRQLQAAGKSDQEIDAVMLPKLTQALMRVKDSKLSNGQPILTPDMQKEVGTLLGGNVRQGLENYAMEHSQAMQHVEAIEKERADALKAQSEDRETKIVMKKGKPHEVMFKKSTGDEVKDLGEAPPSAAMINLQTSKDAAAPASAGVVAAAATGMPLNQLISGYGKGPAAERKAARNGAIKQIQEEKGLNEADAGREYAKRTVEFSAGKTSVAALTKMEGFTRSALAQLDFNVKKASQFMDKVPQQTDLSPVLNSIINKEQTWTGNPNMAPLFMYMNAVSIETARLQSGGQASTAQLHQGAAEEAKKWLDAGAITPASWKKLAPEIVAEGENRLKNFQDAKEAMMPGESSPTPSAGPAAAPPQGGNAAGGAGAPVQVKSVEEANALAPGTVFITPDGRRKVR